MAVSPTINPVLQQSATIELFSHAGAPQSCIPNCPVKGMASEPSQGNSQVQGTQRYSIPTFLLPLALLFILQYFAIPTSFIVTYHRAQTSRIHSRSFVGMAPCVLTRMRSPKSQERTLMSINSHSHSFAFSST